MIREVWMHHRKLGVAFVLASAVALFFILRIGFGLIYWATHSETQIEPWMTVGYVGRSWGLDPREIDQRAGLPLPERGKPQTLEQIARARGQSVAEIVALVEATVATMRAERAAEGP